MEYTILKHFRLSADKLGRDMFSCNTGSTINVSKLKQYGVEGEKLQRYVTEGLLELVKKEDKIAIKKQPVEAKVEAEVEVVK
jgi:hypothetical protein